MKLKRRMFFKIGVTVVIFVAVLLFFIIDVEDDPHGRYQRIPVEDGGMFFMEMAQAEQEGDNSDKQVLKENHFSSDENDINTQINEEQNELLTRKKSQVDDAFVKENLDSAKQEFYYDNSIPDNDGQRKRKKTVELFEPKDQRAVVSRKFTSPDNNKTLVHLCVVVCENRAVEAMTMLKSAVIVTVDVRLVFHIVADKERQAIIQAELESWPRQLHHHLSYHIYDVAFPHSHMTLTAWNKLYKPCASQRLFLPDRLTSLDSLIYVDTDTIFLQSAGALWEFFKKFNTSQLVGLVRESEDGTAGWYNRFANHPFYGEYGVNSGVMLMNLTRIRRDTDWLAVLQQDYETYRLAMTWGDQDLINIYLSKRPDQVYVIPCDWNYRTDHCMYTSNCKAAEERGVSLVHASRGAFHLDKEPVFGAIYQAFQHVILGQGHVASLISELEKRLKVPSSEASSCHYVSSLFLTQLVRLFVLQSSDTSSNLANSHLLKNVDSSSHILSPDRFNHVVKTRQKSHQSRNDGLDKDRNSSIQDAYRFSYNSVSVGRRKGERSRSKPILNDVKYDLRDIGNDKSVRKVVRGEKKLKSFGEGTNKMSLNDGLSDDERHLNNKRMAGRAQSLMGGERDVENRKHRQGKREIGEKK